MSCIRGLLDGGVQDRARRQRDRLPCHVPDRKNYAQRDGKIDSAFEHVAFLLFRTNEQRVGRFEAFGGESCVFHMFNWVDAYPLCKGRATRSG